MSIITANRSVSVLLVATLFLCQTAVASLGLGEGRVESFLGQSLDVRIALVQSGDTSLDSLEVSVASSEDHARLGVPSEALALDLSATLDLSADPPVIRLRSSRPVTDPFVQVLINARWDSGRMLREYTLFIDPPAVPVAPTIRRSEDRQPAQAEAPSDSAAAPPSVADGEPLPASEIEPEPEPEPQTEPQPQEPVPSEAREAAASAVVVERGDTLWSIAADWRPDASLTMNQAMLAIFDRNPEAFIGSNVNRLRRGARLNLPGAEDARAIPAAEAARRFREQIQAWEAGQTTPVAESSEPVEEVAPESSAPEADSAPTEPEPAVPEVAESEETLESEPESQPRLELAPPEEDLVAEAAAIDVERQRLSGQLSDLVTEIAAEGLESAETDALVDQIRQGIDSADAGGMMVANEDLATLEEQLREAREAREAEQRAAEAVQPPVEPPAAVAPGPLATAPASFFERWIWPLAAAGLGLLLIVLFVLVRRRAGPSDEARALEEQGDAAAADKSETSAAAASPVGPETETTPDPSDRAEDEQDAQAAALMGILNRQDEEDEAVGTTESNTEPAVGDEWSRSRDEDAEDDEAPDLARLSNRLDPEERDRPPSLPTGSEPLALEEEEIETLFTADDSAGVPTELPEPEDAGPLTLDFDLPETELDEEDEPSGKEPSDAIVGEADAEVEPEPESTFEWTVQDNASPTEAEASERLEDSSLESSPGGSDPEATASPTEAENFDGFALEEDDEAADAADEDRVEAQADAAAGDAPSESAEASAALGDEDAEVKLDLARAYISMEDPDSARTLLEEIISDGSPAHQEQAQKLLDSLR